MKKIRFYSILFLLLFLSASLRAGEPLPVPGEIVGNIVFKVRDSLVQKIQAFTTEKTSNAYYKVLTGASTFINAADKNTDYWSIGDSIIFIAVNGLSSISLPQKEETNHSLPVKKQELKVDFTPLSIPGNCVASFIQNPGIVAMVNLYKTFQTGNEDMFNRTVKRHAFIVTCMQDKTSLRARFVAWINPFLVLKIIVGFALLLLFVFSCRMGVLLHKYGSSVFILALFPHTFATILNIVIKGNPSVSMFQDPVVFVLWIGFLVGLVLSLIHNDGVRLLIAFSIGFSFLCIAGIFGDRQTIDTLTRVLNRYYLFAAYTMSPILGYVGLITIVFALVKFLIGNPQNHYHKRLHLVGERVDHVLTACRVFTLTGIILGGLWATQTWAGF